MINVLFVDDEPNILSGLQRMLYPMRGEWEMSFATSGQEALDLARKNKFDVIVSDMRMPGMDGAQLLQNIRKEFPQIVRIILSGYSEREMILRSVGSTHQFLAKPCDADSLKATISRACAMRDLLSDEKLRRLVSEMPTVPSIPTLYQFLMRELESEEPSMRTIGDIVRQDMGMTVKILQLVNSAFFGLRRNISDAGEALMFLGLDTISSLTLSIGVFTQFEGKPGVGKYLSEMWNHSVSVGTLAKKIAMSKDTAIVSDAFTAGLLHDVGKLVLAANVPENLREVEWLMKEGMTEIEAERAVFDATHAEVGAYLLGLWGLPNQVVEAIAFHHEPGIYEDNIFSALTAVHVADRLHHSLTCNDGAQEDLPVLDVQYLERANVMDDLDSWRSFAFEQAGEGV